MAAARFGFDLLEPGLGLSAAPESAADLAGTPFRAVLNVSDATEPEYACTLPADMHFVRCPFADGMPAPRPFLACAVLELAALRRQGIPTLVHCQHGQSRSPTVVALYWMARDNISWTEAVARIARRRPRVEPHPWLTDTASRQAVLDLARSSLQGDEAALRSAREQMRCLLQADAHRAPQPDAMLGNWDLIDEGCGLGAPPRSPRELELHFDRLLNVAAHGLRDQEPVPPPQVVAAVRQLHDWRRLGQRVYVHCAEGRSLSGLIVCLVLMVERGWDYASALWYVRGRRRGVSPHPELTRVHSVDFLCALCRNALARD